jgi:hypothetical protein
MATMSTLNAKELTAAGFKFLDMLCDYGKDGAPPKEREVIRHTSGHHWTSGMVRKDEDPPNSHLIEWVGGSRGKKGNLRCATVGFFWAYVDRLARESGLTRAELLKAKLDEQERLDRKR